MCYRITLISTPLLQDCKARQLYFAWTCLGQSVCICFNGLSYHPQEVVLHQMVYDLAAQHRGFETYLPRYLKTIQVVMRYMVEIITICGSFCFPHQYHGGISFVTAYVVFLVLFPLSLTAINTALNSLCSSIYLYVQSSMSFDVLTGCGQQLHLR